MRGGGLGVSAAGAGPGGTAVAGAGAWRATGVGRGAPASAAADPVDSVESIPMAGSPGVGPPAPGPAVAVGFPPSGEQRALALQRLAARPVAPAEAAAIRRMREVIVRHLGSRFEVAAGIARVRVG